jgi:hypothetical protein
MATNTRRAARQREDGSGPSNSQDHTEGVRSHSRGVSEAAASHRIAKTTLKVSGPTREA